MVAALETIVNPFDKNANIVKLDFNSASKDIGIKKSTKSTQLKLTYANTEDSIKEYEQTRNEIICQFEKEIVAIILQDEFVDGEISNASSFIKNAYSKDEISYVKEALMRVYLSKIKDNRFLEGILVMISSVPYEVMEPQGQIMVLGALQNKDLEIRDRAIQCYEKWNSKKGLDALKTLDCQPKWLQQYVEKIIKYIERDGMD